MGPKNCMNHGHCTSQGLCVCLKEWTGVDCGTRQCLTNCSNNGICVHDGAGAGGKFKCACLPGFTGKDCSLRTCDDDCGNAGWCYDGKCECYPEAQYDGKCSIQAEFREVSLNCGFRCVNGCMRKCASTENGSMRERPCYADCSRKCIQVC